MITYTDAIVALVCATIILIGAIRSVMRGAEITTHKDNLYTFGLILLFTYVAIRSGTLAFQGSFG